MQYKRHSFSTRGREGSKKRRVNAVRRTTKRELCAMVCTEHDFPYEGTGGVKKECFGRESNPYGHFCPRDFKSRVSTNSTTKAASRR